jgi:hypothetical protein
MPDWLWDLAQGCFKMEPSERPSVAAVADVLSAVHEEPVKESRIAGGSRTTKKQDPPLLSAASFTNVPEHRPPSPTNTKGKQRLHFGDNFPTVHFGPVNETGDPEDIFSTIFDGLSEVVRRDLLVEPLLVERLDPNYLALRFHTLIEAHSFAMTWMVHRFKPFLEVSALLVDTE